MVHTFKSLDYVLALDVDSGALHIIDEFAKDVIDLYESNTKEEIVQALKHQYDEKDISDLYEEIEELKNDAQLFTNNDYEKVEIVKSDVVKAMCLHVAHDCDLRCRYCFAATGSFHGSRELLDVETGKKAIDFLIKNSDKRKNLEIDFFGGEPLINFEVVKELVKYGRSLEEEYGKVFKFTLTTNGYALTDEIADFLCENMHNVVLSVDGRKSVHDAMRPDEHGLPTYDVIMPKIKKLVQKRGENEYYVRGTFTRENLDFSKDVLSIADEGITQISVEPVVMDANSKFAILEEHLPQIFEQYEILAKNYIKRKVEGRFFNFFHFMIDLEHGPCLKKRLGGCGAGNEYVAVTPKGEIYPCHQFVGYKEFIIGDLHTGSFDKDMQKKFASSTVLSKEKCKDCWAKFHCSGGCIANAYKFSKDLDTPHDIECQMQKKRLEVALAIKAGELDI